MKKFIVLYRAPASAMELMANATAEDMQKGMEPWMAWATRCGSALVDRGTPLGGGQKVSESGSASSDSGIVGYSILQAEDMHAAKVLLHGHPHLGWTGGCEIEVHESMPMSM